MDSQSLSRSVTWVPMRSLLMATNTPPVPRPSFVLWSLRNAVKLDGKTSLVAMLIFNHDSDLMTTWGLWVSMQVAKVVRLFFGFSTLAIYHQDSQRAKRFVGSIRFVSVLNRWRCLCWLKLIWSLHWANTAKAVGQLNGTTSRQAVGWVVRVTTWVANPNKAGMVNLLISQSSQVHAISMIPSIASITLDAFLAPFAG